jgi:cell division protein FtsB
MAQGATTVRPAQPRQPTEPAQPTQAKVGVPTNQAELNSLGLLREEFRSQIRSTTQLRQELTNQIAQASALNDGASVAKLQARVRALDTRSATLEERILQVDDAMTNAIARGVASTEVEAVVAVPAMPGVPGVPPVFERRGPVGEDIASIVLGMTLLFTLIGVLIHRRAWRRAEKQFATVGPGNRAELQQLQQAVDVIAVEVERISEGQRYVSKLLNERLDVTALPDGRERVPAALEDADPTPRGR